MGTKGQKPNQIKPTQQTKHTSGSFVLERSQAEGQNKQAPTYTEKTQSGHFQLLPWMWTGVWITEYFLTWAIILE